MNLVQRFWSDEDGVILSMETVLLGTIGVLGLTTGLSFLASAVNAELEDLGSAIRGVDQSFAVEGGQNCAASKAGSSYQQMSVQETLLDLRTGVCQPTISGDVGIAPDDDIDIDIELEIERGLFGGETLKNMLQDAEQEAAAENQHEPGPGQSDDRHSDQVDREQRKHKSGRSKKQGRPHDGRHSRGRQESDRPLKDL